MKIYITGMPSGYEVEHLARLFYPMAPLTLTPPEPAEDCLWAEKTGKVKPCSKQLAANPKAEISAFHNGTWIRLAGELVEDDRVEAKKSMLDAYPNLRGMYDENDGNTQVFYFRNATATFSSFTAAPETVTF